MKVAFFDTHSYDRDSFERENDGQFEIDFLDVRLSDKTAFLASGHPVVCAFVNDKIDQNVVKTLHEGGTQLIALRCAGYNQVDLEACQAYGVKVVRVPAYSPYAVAEHALALLLTLNRKIHRAFNRVRELNCSLDGLVGFDLHGKTIGIIGLGKIGSVFAKICNGLGMEILAYDPGLSPDKYSSVPVKFMSLEDLLKNSDIISLHLPLLPSTFHLLNKNSLKLLKRGAIIVNTSRGALIDTPALVRELKRGHIGGAALDVYEEEEGIFFSDHSGEVLQDDVLARLLTFPNVIITSHQAFLTKEALGNIAKTTLTNISSFVGRKELTNEVKVSPSI